MNISQIVTQAQNTDSNSFINNNQHLIVNVDGNLDECNISLYANSVLVFVFFNDGKYTSHSIKG